MCARKLSYKESRRAFLIFVRDLNCAYQIIHKVMETYEDELRHNLPGVYIQLRENGDVYIGEAVDIIQRQKQHIAKGVVLKGLAVIPMVGVDMKMRFSFETELITRAVERGLMLANDSKMKLAMEKIKAKSPQRLEWFKIMLDVMAQKMEDELGEEGWVRRCARSRADMDEADWEKYDEFITTGRTTELVVLVNRYVRRVLPEPEKTYGTFWWIEVSADLRSPFISVIVQTWTQPLMKARIVRKTQELILTADPLGDMDVKEFHEALDSGRMIAEQSEVILRAGLVQQRSRRGDLGRLFLL